MKITRSQHSEFNRLAKKLSECKRNLAIHQIKGLKKDIESGKVTFQSSMSWMQEVVNKNGG